MTRRTSAAVRMLCLVLVALAFSPLTAPFATLDLSALDGERRPGAAVHQSKPAPDQSIADLVPPGSSDAVPPAAGVDTPRPTAVRPRVRTHPIPLRL